MTPRFESSDTTVTPLISGLDRTIITKGHFCHSYEATSALTTSFELATVDCRGKIFVFVQSEIYHTIYRTVHQGNSLPRNLDRVLRWRAALVAKIGLRCVFMLALEALNIALPHV